MKEIIEKVLNRFSHRNMDLARPSDRKIIAAEIDAVLKDRYFNVIKDETSKITTD